MAPEMAGWAVGGRVGGQADLPEQRASFGDPQRSRVFKAREKECEGLCILALVGLIWEMSEGKSDMAVSLGGGDPRAQTRQTESRLKREGDQLGGRRHS